MTRLRHLVFLAAVLALPLSHSAAADGAYVTGVDWQASSKAEKLAYMLGISNLMSADYERQQKKGGTSRSAIPEMYRATSNVSIPAAVATVDAWFKANPDKIKDTVLDVMWMTLVKR